MRSHINPIIIRIKSLIFIDSLNHKVVPVKLIKFDQIIFTVVFVFGYIHQKFRGVVTEAKTVGCEFHQNK